MKSYIVRRLLLMIPTLLGITIVCFTLIQMVPGGPIDELLAKQEEAAARSGGVSPQFRKEQREALIKAYGFDKPAHIRYLTWLWKAVRLDLGDSLSYHEPVWKVISERFPISLFFGFTSFILSYLICVPLGVQKALRNHSRFDTVSSILVFTGYVIPGYALGILLIMSVGVQLNWFPVRGMVSDNFEALSFFGKMGDFLHHMTLPLICFMISEFAFLTMLMKNSLLDEIRKDYMRTAVVKGVRFHMAVYRHALRNALIPVATRLSEIFTLILTGALLIEKVFDIDGIGLLSFNSIVSRDYPVVMGVIFIGSILTMLGRLFSDILYVVIDPRIRLS